MPDILDYNQQHGIIAGIWVLGDSIVRWAGVQYHERARPSSIDWSGYSGLKVEELHSKIQHGLLAGKDPKLILIHVGGNNITDTNTCKITRILQREIKYICDTFHDSLVVWTYFTAFSVEFKR